MKFQSAFLAIFVALGKLAKVSTVVEFRSSFNHFERQMAVTPAPEAKWRLVFNSCAASCGGSYQKGSAVCMKGDFRTDESECTDSKPPDAVHPCGQQPCFTPDWRLYNFSDCTATCGIGFIFQVAKCYIASRDEVEGKEVYIEVAERMCATIPRPTIPAKLCTGLPNCTLAVAKVDPGGCPTPPCIVEAAPAARNTCAERSAIETAIVLGAATCLALLRIYLFNS